MRLITYRTGGTAGTGSAEGTRVGVMVDATGFVDLAKHAPELPTTIRGLLALGPDWQARVEKAVKGKSADNALDKVTLDPVIPNTQVVWALALNFQLHKDETGLERSQYPELFNRMPCSLVGHNRPIVKPRDAVAKMYDFEGEIAFIVGKPGRYVAEKDAMSYIAGYAPFNEGSVRDYQRHNRQFGLGKNFEKSGSFGPWLMTRDELPDPNSSRIVTRLNGVERQNTVAGEMIFSIANLIHYISTGHTLLPGDVIVCGTPGALPGKKAHMNVGDVCEVEVTGLGVLRNTVAAEAPPAPAYAREAAHAK